MDSFKDEYLSYMAPDFVITKEKNKQMVWDKYYLRQAVDLAETKSYARRLKVGAIAVRDNRPIANGYNGTPAGFPNNCEEEIKSPKAGVSWKDVFEDYKSEEIEITLKTLPIVVHAELNLVAYCARFGIALDGCTVYQTVPPCMNCCLALKGAGVKRIVYISEYRHGSEAWDFLRQAGIQLDKIENIRNGTQ